MRHSNRVPSIREFQRNDASEVASLFEAVFRSGTRNAPIGLSRQFETLFLDHPWFDASIPSLVWVDDRARVKGFLGSHVRRVLMGDEQIKVAFVGQLASDFDVRGKAVGFRLLQAFFAGCQDMTMTDTAGEPTSRIWQALGGRTVPVNCVEWFRFFRPWRFASSRLEKRIGRPRIAAATGPLWSFLDEVTALVAGKGLQPRPPSSVATREMLTPRLLATELSRAASSFRLSVGYDEDFLAWLFRMMATMRSRGRLVGRLVRERDSVVGWYVYYSKPGEIAEVLQAVAPDRHLGVVLDDLFWHASREKAAVVRGRLEPGLLHALAERRVMLRASTNRTLVHSRNQAILDALLTGPSLITRFDGEWWTAYEAESLFQ